MLLLKYSIHMTILNSIDNIFLDMYMCICLVGLMDLQKHRKLSRKVSLIKKVDPSYNRNLKRHDIRPSPTRMSIDLRITVAKFYLRRSVPQIMSVNLRQVKWYKYLTETSLTLYIDRSLNRKVKKIFLQYHWFSYSVHRFLAYSLHYSQNE